MFSGGLINPSIFHLLLAHFLEHFSLFCSLFAASAYTFLAYSLYFSSIFFLTAFSFMNSMVSSLVSRSEGGLFGLAYFFWCGLLQNAEQLSNYNFPLCWNKSKKTSLFSPLLTWKKFCSSRLLQIQIQNTKILQKWAKVWNKSCNKLQTSTTENQPVGHHSTKMLKSSKFTFSCTCSVLSSKEKSQ